MKSLNQKFNEEATIQLGQVTIVNEAWGAIRHYGSELTELFNKYEKKKNAKPSKHMWTPARTTTAEDILAKYPMQILIDKAGYQPSTIKRFGYVKGVRTEKDVYDKRHYGEFIANQLKDGKLNKDDMLKWWNEYEETVMKAKWHDPKYIVKQIDPSRCWNPYYPKDDSILQSFITCPANIVHYLKLGKGAPSYSERIELGKYFTDPVNQEELSKALKGVKNQILKARPSFKTGVIKHVEDLIKNCDYSEGDLQKFMDAEWASDHQTYYQGGNDSTCEGSAVIGLILKVINKLYGFELWSCVWGEKDENNWLTVKPSVSVKGEVSDDTLEGFLNDAKHLEFKIKKLGRSKKEESTSVSNSSFTSFYNYDFEVICTKDDEEVFHETITDVTTGSYFFSGGWN